MRTGRMGSNSSLSVSSRADLQESWDLLRPTLSLCAAGLRSVAQSTLAPFAKQEESGPDVLYLSALVISAEKLTEDPNPSAPSMPTESEEDSLAPKVFNIE